MKSSFQIKKTAQNVIKIECDQIKSLLERIDDNFVNAVETIANSIGIVHLHDIINAGVIS